MNTLIPDIQMTKEEARIQFNDITEKLGLKHTFSFDEVYDVLMERRIAKQKQHEFRDNITTFERLMLKEKTSKVGNAYPLEHSFADGTYIRKLMIPGGVLTVTKIHAVTHPFFLMRGAISIYSQEGITHHIAPYHGITLAGTKRMIYHHTDVEFITVHPNPDNGQDVEVIEDRVTVKSFEALTQDEKKQIIDFSKTVKGASICHS